MLTCRVLGPTEVDAGDRRVPLGGPLPRRLITALIAAEGRPLTETALATTIWPQALPASATVSLQSHISRLRAALGPFRDSLERVPNGYRLRTVTDTTTFAAHVERGRLILAAHPWQAARAFEAALRLWRGVPYADLPATPSIQPARDRLEELRAAAVEERLAARLAVTDPRSLLPDLEAAVRAHANRPRRWEIFILALARSNRLDDASAALQKARKVLDPTAAAALRQVEAQLAEQPPG